MVWPATLWQSMTEPPAPCCLRNNTRYISGNQFHKKSLVAEKIYRLIREGALCWEWLVREGLLDKDDARDQQNIVLIHRWSLYIGLITWKVYH